MRHLKGGRKLGRTADARQALMRSLAIAILKHEQIRTTLPKAKELRRFVEPFVTRARTDSVANRRLVFSRLRDQEIVDMLFRVYGPRYRHRPGGYTRVTRIGFRNGDSAPMALIQFVDQDDAIDATAKAVAVESKKKPPASGGEKTVVEAAVVGETAAAEAAAVEVVGEGAEAKAPEAEAAVGETAAAEVAAAEVVGEDVEAKAPEAEAAVGETAAAEVAEAEVVGETAEAEVAEAEVVGEGAEAKAPEAEAAVGETTAAEAAEAEVVGEGAEAKAPEAEAAVGETAAAEVVAAAAAAGAEIEESATPADESDKAATKEEAMSAIEARGGEDDALDKSDLLMSAMYSDDADSGADSKAESAEGAEASDADGDPADKDREK